MIFTMNGMNLLTLTLITNIYCQRSIYALKLRKLLSDRDGAIDASFVTAQGSTEESLIPVRPVPPLCMLIPIAGRENFGHLKMVDISLSTGHHGDVTISGVQQRNFLYVRSMGYLGFIIGQTAKVWGKDADRTHLLRAQWVTERVDQVQQPGGVFGLYRIVNKQQLSMYLGWSNWSWWKGFVAIPKTQIQSNDCLWLYNNGRFYPYSNQNYKEYNNARNK
eukprot:58745_1